MPNFIKIEDFLWTDVCTHVRTYARTDDIWDWLY